MTAKDTRNFFGIKAWRRLLEWDPAMARIDRDLYDKILKACEIIGEDTWVTGHGDLNFTNILYSLNTGSFKLIDPRGGAVPLIYEYAKLAYSPGFSAVVHDLFDVDTISTFPMRHEEIESIITELTKDVEPERLTAAIALTFLAACPLHDAAQAEMFYSVGRKMLDAVVGEKA